MNRNEFLQNSLIIAGSAMLPKNSLFAATVNEGGIDNIQVNFNEVDDSSIFCEIIHH